MQSPQRRHLFSIFLAGAVVSFPAWFYGFAAASDDSVSHAVWYAHFSKQFWSGHLYPRWLPDMNAGLGSPVFYYYAPLPYQLTSLLKPFFPTHVSPLRPLGVAAALALLASGLAAYFWLREISAARAALIGAIIYMVAPYHLAFDLFLRDAFAEVFAFVWLPLIMCFARGVRDGRKYSPVWLALCYALLVLTHLPTTLIFSAIPVCYVFFVSPRGHRTRALMITIGAMMLGAGLAAIYLLPAMTTQGYVSMRELEGGLYYEKFVPSVTASIFRHQGKILWCVVTTAALVACAHFAARAQSKNEESVEKNFWLTVAALSVFMMTVASEPVWRLLPVLQRIQFPWRFNLLLCLAAAASVALSLDSLKRSGARTSRRVVGFVSLILSGWIVITSISVWQAYGNREQSREFERGVGVWVALGRDTPEYKPAWAPSNTPEYLESLGQRFCRDGEQMAKACVVGGDAALVVERWQPGDISLRVSGTNGARVNVRQFYFPDWRVLIDGSPLSLSPSAPDGLLGVAVPGGEHRVELSLQRGAAERAGRIASAVSVALLLIVGLCLKLRGQVRQLSS